MPDIFELAPQRMTRMGGQIRMLVLNGLHAGQLIHADRAFSLCCPFRSLRIRLEGGR